MYVFTSIFYSSSSNMSSWVVAEDNFYVKSDRIGPTVCHKNICTLWHSSGCNSGLILCKSSLQHKAALMLLKTSMLIRQSVLDAFPRGLEVN